jgi:hypothetical protein
MNEKNKQKEKHLTEGRKEKEAYSSRWRWGQDKD